MHRTVLEESTRAVIFRRVFFDELGKRERRFRAKLLISYIDMASFSDYILNCKF